ncbi:MAG: hypothetical protein U5Q03_08855 [Bacteroidota bacterium]|nr:hypothetical protein [Bacteroidota bacterium]
MTFFKIILILGLIYFASVFIIRYLLPWFIKKQFNKARENFYGDAGNRQDHKTEGDMNIRYKKDKDQKKKDEDLGEYVDYEEIKD